MPLGRGGRPPYRGLTPRQVDFVGDKLNLALFHSLSLARSNPEYDANHPESPLHLSMPSFLPSYLPSFLPRPLPRFFSIWCAKTARSYVMSVGRLFVQHAACSYPREAQVNNNNDVRH